MKESYIEGLANHDDPESCACRRKVSGEALTGARIGRVMSCEIRSSRVPTPLSWSEGDMGMHAMASASSTLRSRRPLACAETPCARTGRSRVFPAACRDALGRSRIKIQ
jgi:hypothetical protein